MGIQARLELYKQIEARRKRPLIVYVTSSRLNGNGQIAADSVAELIDQLQRLPAGTKELDLMIVSDGGDPTVAWRMVSLIRERATKFSALVPQAAYSAATPPRPIAGQSAARACAASASAGVSPNSRC